MCFNQNGVISALNGKHLKLVDLGSKITPTESDVNIHLGKPWTAIDRLMTKWKSDLSGKIKQTLNTV